MRMITLSDETGKKVFVQIKELRDSFPSCDVMLLSQEEFALLSHFLYFDKLAHEKCAGEDVFRFWVHSPSAELRNKIKLESILYALKEESVAFDIEGGKKGYLVPIDKEYCDFLESAVCAFSSFVSLVAGC